MCSVFASSPLAASLHVGTSNSLHARRGGSRLKALGSWPMAEQACPSRLLWQSDSACRRSGLPQKRKSHQQPVGSQQKKAKSSGASSCSHPRGVEAASGDGLSRADTDVGPAAESARHNGKDWKSCARCKLLGLPAPLFVLALTLKGVDSRPSANYGSFKDLGRR